MPIYVESRNLDHPAGFVAEHQYLVYIPVGEELDYSAWKYIGAFPSDPDIPDGSILTRASIADDLFKDAVADRWKMNEFSVASYDVMVFNPLHYLPLIEHKIMAFDQAAPLQGWKLPDAFITIQRLLEARQGKTGKREYVQVLRLLERFDMKELHGAIKDALHMGAISFDAIKHLVLCRVEHRPARLDLDVYPFLPRTNVATTSASAYMSLLAGGAS